MEEMKQQMEDMLNKMGTNQIGSQKIIDQNNTGEQKNTNCRNTNSHNNQTQNITINSYGSEDIKHITPEYLTKLLKFSPNGAVPKLAKEIHFNDKFPENKNIKITNKKMPYVSVYEDDKWIYKNKDKMITDIVNEKFDIIDEHYENHGQDDLNQRQQDRYVQYKRNMENDKTNETQKLQKEEIDLLILNFSK